MEEEKEDRENNIKKVSVIAFTRNGSRLALALADSLSDVMQVQVTLLKHFFGEADLISKKVSVQRIDETLTEWTKKQFSQKDALIFVGAVGIAVRAIAPYVKDKLTDPAVIVLDERGLYCIPLLSGHVGGANELASLISANMGSFPVITTASDLYGGFAVDVFAVKNKMVIWNRDGIRQIAGSLLEGEEVGLFTDFCRLSKKLPEGITLGKMCEKNIVISIKRDPFWEEEAAKGRALILIPKCVTVGMGCRKGVEKSVLKSQTEEAFQTHSIYIEAVSCLASVDRKREEKGMLELAKEFGWEFVTYSAEELEEAEGEFMESPFVKKILGVGNVCERAAVLHSGGRLCFPKCAVNGMTVAAAYSEREIQFEKGTTIREIGISR